MTIFFSSRPMPSSLLAVVFGFLFVVTKVNGQYLAQYVYTKDNCAIAQISTVNVHNLRQGECMPDGKGGSSKGTCDIPGGTYTMMDTDQDENCTDARGVPSRLDSCSIVPFVNIPMKYECTEDIPSFNIPNTLEIHSFTDNACQVPGVKDDSAEISVMATGSPINMIFFVHAVAV
eukprot:TRINITY_DN7238_c0_g1_i2.p1 TRINITY_DN7238_c0_g1~~TRINITY_DN7238_c0_g1_i2.p1  ORF type:complete len:190 (+),score=22.98 TRINITY_DN7238_c0_g1_i2:46-570(+)